MTYRRRLRAEIDRLRALAADSTCHEDTKRQLTDLIADMEQHLWNLDHPPVGTPAPGVAP